MRRLAAGAIAILVMALPVVANASDDDLPTVQLQIEVGADTYTEPSGLTIRSTPGEPVTLRVAVFEEGDQSSPVEVGDTSTLLEIREASGVGPGVRFADMEEIGAGNYETSYTFAQGRDYVIELLPDVDDRSLLTPETTDQVTLMVQPEPEAAATGPLWPTIIATVALVLVVGVLVARATRGRRRVAKEPMHHDTWWNSP